MKPVQSKTETINDFFKTKEFGFLFVQDKEDLNMDKNMKTIFHWVGTRPKVKCAGFKKDLILQPWQTDIRIQFNFEVVYCIKDGENLVLQDGKLFPITIVYSEFGPLIGFNDPYQTGLDYNEKAIAFRKALDERNSEKKQKI